MNLPTICIQEEEEEVQAAETLVQSSEKQASPIDILESTIEDEFTSTQSPEPACTQSPELLRDPAQLFATIAKSNIRKLSEAERVRLRKVLFFFWEGEKSLNHKMT